MGIGVGTIKEGELYLITNYEFFLEQDVFATTFHGLLVMSLHLPVLHYYISTVFLFYLPFNQLRAIIKGMASLTPC